VLLLVQVLLVMEWFPDLLTLKLRIQHLTPKVHTITKVHILTPKAHIHTAKAHMVTVDQEEVTLKVHITAKAHMVTVDQEEVTLKVHILTPKVHTTLKVAILPASPPTNSS
jgi:hypothetical protein